MANLEQLENAAKACDKSQFEINRELEALRKGIRSMKELCGEDDLELLADMIEGETDLIPFCEMCVDQIEEDKAFATALDEQIKKMQARKTRIEKRAEHSRSIMAMVIDEAGQKTLKTARSTITVGQNKPGVIIQDEEKIPSKYWKRPDPRIDKATLRKDALAALDSGQVQIPGITLDNGSLKITVRTQ